MEASKFRFASVCLAVSLLTAEATQVYAQANDPFLFDGRLAQTVLQRELQPNTALINDLSLRESAETRKTRAQVTAAVRRFLEVELDEIKQVCALSKGQLANFETAAEVAIENTIDGLSQDSVKLEPPRIESETAQRRHVETTNRRLVLSDNVWTRAVEGLLTREQKTKLAAVRAQRSKFARLATSYEIVAILDQELLLNEEQRQRILKVVSSGEARVLRKASLVALQLDKATADAAMQLLSKPQWEKWQQLTLDVLNLGVEIRIQ